MCVHIFVYNFIHLLNSTRLTTQISPQMTQPCIDCISVFSAKGMAQTPPRTQKKQTNKNNLLHQMTLITSLSFFPLATMSGRLTVWRETVHSIWVHVDSTGLMSPKLVCRCGARLPKSPRCPLIFKPFFMNNKIICFLCPRQPYVPRCSIHPSSSLGQPYVPPNTLPA
jgi:hypothetical protein